MSVDTKQLETWAAGMQLNSVEQVERAMAVTEKIAREMTAPGVPEFTRGQAHRCELALDAYEVAKKRLPVLRSIEDGTAVLLPGVGGGVADQPDRAADLHRRGPGRDYKGFGLRAIEACRFTPDDGKERATRLIEHATNSYERDALAHQLGTTANPSYLSAFGKLLADPTRGSHRWTDDEMRAVRAVEEARAASLSDSAGGYAVPFTLDPTVILTNSGVQNPIRQLAKTVTIVTDTWNGVSSAGVTASWDAEGAEVSDDAPTLAQPSIPAHKAQAFVPFSVEVGGDWEAFAHEVRQLMFDARDRLEGVAHMTGSGSGQPTGIVTALAGGGSVVTPTTGETFAWADVGKVARALPARHWGNATWLVHRGTSLDIRDMIAAQTDSSSWTDAAGDDPPKLLGRPLAIGSEMDDASTINPAATADNYIVLLGDWSNYVIVDRVGMTVELVPHLFATGNNRPSGQRGFWAWWRTGADSVNDDGFRVLNVATTA